MSGQEYRRLDVDNEAEKADFTQMNLIVTLPPKAEQDALVEKWVDVLMGEVDSVHFHDMVGQCLKAGFSIHGITCLLLHQYTADAALKRVRREESIQLEAAFSKPICMN